MLGHVVRSVIRSRQLAENCAGRIGVISEVYDTKVTILKIIGVVERPERRLQRAHDKSRTLDFRRVSFFE